MTDLSENVLAPEVDLALAWTPQPVREALRVAFALDRRLARIVGQTTEPMLGQMRLAWWRGVLGQPAAERPRGDAVLDAAGVHWAGREAALIAMVDGWEVLVSATTLSEADVLAFARGRSAFFAGLLDGPTPAQQDHVAAAGIVWALTDAAAAVSDPDERALVLAVADAQKPPSGPLPASLCGLGVLAALARRSLRRGGRPLMEGRGASLIALGAAIFLR